MLQRGGQLSDFQVKVQISWIHHASLITILIKDSTLQRDFHNRADNSENQANKGANHHAIDPDHV